jgi:condensin complex subunit 2
MPEMLSSMLRPVRGRDQSKGVFNREEDVIWGEVRGGQQGQAQAQGLFSAEAVHAAEDDKVDYVFEDDDNDNDYSPPDDSDLLPAGEEQPRGLKIRMSGMLKAARTVQRIQVSYATTSKRVNVSKLKKDIWSHLDASIGAPPAADASRDQQDSSLSSSVSFHEVMDEVAREQQQSDVTVSFYFICLLHLANEKNLVITGCEAMDDLVVGCDCE